MQYTRHLRCGQATRGLQNTVPYSRIGCVSLSLRARSAMLPQGIFH
jgi:hypothetical protein